MDAKLFETLRYWITEREAIHKRKIAGDPKPWTNDPILQSYRFCNVRREDDRVTEWFARNWRAEKYWDEKNFIPAMIFARTINWPSTLAELDFPFTWEPERYLAVMDEIQAAGKKVYTGAYMITAGPTGVRKNAWVVGNAETYFLNPPVLDPHSIRISWEEIINNKYPCVGPFIAGQVIADLKQTKHLAKAKDWWSWAAIGPGSARGLNRLSGRPLKFGVSQNQGLSEMREVRMRLGELGDQLCLQDIQNCLCELDKYVRVLNGEGKPRSGYLGK